MNFKLVSLAIVIVLSAVTYYAITSKNSAKKVNVSKEELAKPSALQSSHSSPFKKTKFTSQMFRNAQISKTQQEIDAQEKYIKNLSPELREQNQKELEKKKKSLQRSKLAKKRYESKQREIQNRKKQEKARKSYYSSQKMISKRNPQTMKNSKDYGQSKPTRAKVAQNEYKKRQIQMQERIKMQNKLRQNIPNKENN